MNFSNLNNILIEVGAGILSGMLIEILLEILLYLLGIAFAILFIVATLFAMGFLVIEHLKYFLLLY